MLDESLPRYFLDFTDTGELLRDHEGMELVDLEAARLRTCILISTRGGAFLLTSLEARLKCPMCGSRRVSVIFDVPSEPAAMRIAGMPSR
jgi:Domain of unknown function (DUF6894)